ncbi:MAG: metal-dependent transcriptional regulator [Verrucomicrobia bacterium]|jgi:DtxR family transcriptional regulator, Mn-dependent transcriptional regulator|nr:metal-dependent transcriptional regulator [Verrucomicrobiota bacterium]
MATVSPISAALEDYLEAILALSENGGTARVRDISERVSVHKSTVTAALKTLSERKLVDHEPYGAVTLTVEGRRIAARIARSHAVVKAFLKDVLLVDSHTAEENACRMEHVMDKVVLERLVSFADFMGSCSETNANCLRRFADHLGVDSTPKEEA